MKKNFSLKNIFKVIFTFILTAIIIPTNVYAASAPSNLTMKYRNYTPPISFPQTFHVKETTDGKYVFCMTYAKNMPVTSVKYTRSGKYTDPGVNYILEQGYNAKNDKEYFVAQTALWIYLMDKGDMDYSNTINTFKSNISKSSGTYATKIKNMVKKAKTQKSYDQSNPTISLSSGNVTFTLSSDKKYYISNEITVKSSESSYKVTLSDAPTGTTYTDNNGKITVKVPVSSVTQTASNFSIKVSTSKTIYTSYKYKPSNSKYQVMAATYATKKSVNDSKNMSLAVDKIVISKQDVTTKQELKGATLVVKDSNGNVVDSWVSTTTPHEIINLTPGTYTLTETIAPEGYQLSKETISFEVTNKGVTTPVVMYNSPKETRYLYISKQDITTKQELPGATLELRKSDGTLIDSWVSTTTPHVIPDTDLPAGTYTLTETIAPEGYDLSTESITFEIKEEGEITPVVMYNTPTKKVESKVSISKVDSDSKDFVEGATLQILDNKGNVVKTIISESKATIIEGLEAGTYTLIETEAPDGYELSSEKVEFTIKENSEETVYVTFTNKKTPEETPKEEVVVPDTASYKTIASSMIGIITLIAGSVLITKNLKKKNEI